MPLLIAAGGLVIIIMVAGFIYMSAAAGNQNKIKTILAEQEQELKKMGFDELVNLVATQPEAKISGNVLRKLTKEIIHHDDAQILQVRITMQIVGNAELLEESIITKRRENK